MVRFVCFKFLAGFVVGLILCWFVLGCGCWVDLIVIMFLCGCLICVFWVGDFVFTVVRFWWLICG